MSAADYYGLSGLAQALNKLWTLSQSMSEPDRRTLVAKISETPLQTALPGIDPGLAQHWPGLHAAGLADIDQLAEKPNAFFGALDKADEKAADDQLQAETFARCVGAYTCECGSRFEFTEESDLTDFAALNSWHGHHNRCAEFRELEATGMALVGTVRHPSLGATSPAVAQACASGD